MDQTRILVVDDEETILFVISKVLESHGYQVFAVTSAEKARELLDVTTVDAALLDLVLPGQSGLELLRIIKREHSDTEVIMMTSHASIDTAVQAMREGAYDYLHKPFEDIDDVWSCVSRALDRGRLARLNRELVAKQEQANRELSVLVQRLKSLVHAGQVMGKLRNEAELFDFVLQQVRLELGAERISVMLVNQDTGQLRIVASLGLEHVQVSEVRVPMGSGIAGRVAATGEPVLAIAGEDPADSFMSAPIVMSAPLVGWHRTLGVINVTARPSGQPFEQQDLQFLEGLSGQVATSIERVRHLEELQKAYDSLKSAQDHAVAVEKLRALGQMAAGVAHDFNNTLAVILARSEAAIWEADGQSPSPAGIRSQLEHVLKAAREGAATVRRIQEYSGIRRDQPAGSVDLNLAVQNVIELARPRWQSDPGARGIRIDVDTDFADVPAVRSNPADLSAVLSNLIFNSVEAMPQRRPHHVRHAVGGRARSAGRHGYRRGNERGGPATHLRALLHDQEDRTGPRHEHRAGNPRPARGGDRGGEPGGEGHHNHHSASCLVGSGGARAAARGDARNRSDRRRWISPFFSWTTMSASGA